MDPDHRNIKPLGLAGLVLAVSVLAVGFPFAVLNARSMRAQHAQSSTPAGAAVQSAAAWSGSSTSSNAEGAAGTVPAGSAATSSAAPVTAGATSVAPGEPSVDAYRGLASWVDIWDDRAWANPRAAVADMATHGVRTLFVETGNSASPTALKNPAALQAFIREAHARDMQVVAWYLPGMRNEPLDYRRIAAAIDFKTADGQKFDSFALDIESDAISSETARNHALERLSTKIRAHVGPTYPLGAIIPAPVGLMKKRGYWNAFPYTKLARTYDVFLPMGYYTYHGNGGSVAAADTSANVSILRAQKGCSEVPIHLIGGLAENSSPAEIRAFVRAEKKAQCIGASLYGWAGTHAPDWRALKPVTQ